LCIAAQGCVPRAHTAGSAGGFRGDPEAPVWRAGCLEMRRRFGMIRFSLMLSAMLVLTTIAASGGEQLRIAVTPLQSFAPSNVNVRARLVPSHDNRALQVIVESGDFYRSSQISLEGEQAPAMVVFDFRGLPSGDYEVSAILTDAGGHRRAVAQQSARVVPSWGQ
jgi:hypothetical protein